MSYSITIKRKFWFDKKIKAVSHIIENEIGDRKYPARLVIEDYLGNTFSFDLVSTTYTVGSDFKKLQTEKMQKMEKQKIEREQAEKEAAKEQYLAEALKKAQMWDNMQAQNNVQPMQKKTM